MISSSSSFIIILNYKKETSSPVICDRHIAHTHTQRTRRGCPRLTGGFVASPNRHRVCLRIECTHKAAPFVRCAVRVPARACWRRHTEVTWSMCRWCPPIRPPALRHYASPLGAWRGSPGAAGRRLGHQLRGRWGSPADYGIVPDYPPAGTMPLCEPAGSLPGSPSWPAGRRLGHQLAGGAHLAAC